MKIDVEANVMSRFVDTVVTHSVTHSVSCSKCPRKTSSALWHSHAYTFCRTLKEAGWTMIDWQLVGTKDVPDMFKFLCPDCAKKT